MNSDLQFSHSHHSIANAAKLLGHPARVAILDILKEKSNCLTSGAIVAQIPLGRSTVLQHLTVLKDAGWVKGSLSGGQINYCLDAPKIHSDMNELQHFLTSLESTELVPCIGPSSHREKILFLCTGNSCRSQMAEAFFRHYGKNTGFEAASAGTVPSNEIHPLAIKVMEERGISLKGQSPKSADLFRGENSASMVLFVCSQAEKDCPFLFPHARRTVAIPFDDPAAVQGNEEEKLAAFRRIRDEIEEKIQRLIREMM